MKKTKIICSIGPASQDLNILENLAINGMNVARINFSHATNESIETIINNLEEVKIRTNNQIGLLYDTKGPEFRSKMTENGSIELVQGKTIKIVKDDLLGNQERFTVNFPSVLDGLKIGDKILLENGLMEVEVINKIEDFGGGVNCLIKSGGILKDKKSLNVPGVKLNTPFISEQDYKDIVFACLNKADFLACSFVSSKEDILQVRAILKEQNREDLKIISKIESKSGVENIDEIIENSDGIMIARGDLGVEVPMYDLPILQKVIITKCREQGKICIVATEMLASMTTNLRPTRAEVSDVANAVLDGCDAVMLSGETTIGKYPEETVKYMADICYNTEKHMFYDNYNFSNSFDIAETIAKSVITAANELDVEVIGIATMTGSSAQKVSNLLPKSPILACCPNQKVERSLSLNYGIYTTTIPFYNSTDEIINSVKNECIIKMNLQTKDLIIITGGLPGKSENYTNIMKIEEI